MIQLKCCDTKQVKWTVPTFPEIDKKKKNLSEMSSAIKVLLKMK